MTNRHLSQTQITERTDRYPRMNHAPPLPTPSPPFLSSSSSSSTMSGAKRRILSPCLLMVVIISFSEHPAVGAAGDPKKEDCKPTSCGAGPNISFPFWIAGIHKSYCGYPAFKLNCSDDHRPVLNLSGEVYHILDIFYSNKTLVVTKGLGGRGSGGAQGTSCPFPTRNLTLSQTPFGANYTSQLLFLLSCTSHFPAPGIAIDCASRGTTKSYVANRTLLPDGGVQPSINGRSCESLVVAPFTPVSGMNFSDYRVFLNYSFRLNWTAPDCSNCDQSGGRCGYDEESHNFMCICSDRPHKVSCGKKINTTLKILIGVASLAGGFVLACGLVYLRHRHKRKKRSTSLSALIRSTSSEAYSMEKDPESLTNHLPIFSYKELEEATSGFADSQELGDGGFGTVYKGKLRDGRVVAVKRLYENNYRRVEQFMNEVVILSQLRHPNLVSLYGCTSRHSRGLLLVYEYVPNGTVADHLHGPLVDKRALTWPVRMSIAIETAGALTYLHANEPQIIHRDVKTNNILLDDGYHVKVADFGLSRLFPPDATHVSTVPQGTPGYLDPDYHQVYQLTDKSDVYSFGVVLAELMSSKPAVDITRHRNEINLSNMAMSKIQNSMLQEFVDPALGFDSDQEVRSMIEQVAELAFRCLQAEKDMRPPMEEVLEVLRTIADGHCKEVDGLDARKQTADDISLLNAAVQYSPDTVQAEWVSRSTTPSVSG